MKLYGLNSVLKVYISYFALAIMLVSTVHDFVSGTINLRGATFNLNSDFPIFIGFGLFKIIAALGFVIYYRKLDKDSGK